MKKPTSHLIVFIGLCWLYVCIHLDRQILGILAESVKSDLGLNDQQVGTLTGSAFSFVYALLGLYFGRVADRGDRLRLVVSGAWVWSLSTMAGALANGYPLLVASRGGVALGEAIATAAAVSLMAELAGDAHRGRASSIFFSSAFVGAGMAAILGGSVVEWLRASDAVAGWRAALVVAGIPGIVGALALRRIHLATALEREPVQDPIDLKAAVGLGVAALLVMGIQILAPPIAAVPLSAGIAALVGGWSIRNLARVDAASFDATLGQPAFRWWLLAFGALLFVDYAAVFWLLPYAQRRYSVSAAMAGGELGGLLIVGGVLGCLVGGWWADRWRRRRHAGRVWTALIAVLCEGFAISAALCMPHYPQFVGAFAIFCLASGGWTGVAAAIGLDIVPRQHRGIATALYFLVTTVVGLGLGPFTVGWMSDHLASIGGALAWSCTVLAVAVLGLWKLAFAMHQTPLKGPGVLD